jgi:hypothetical protein
VRALRPYSSRPPPDFQRQMTPPPKLWEVSAAFGNKTTLVNLAKSLKVERKKVQKIVKIESDSVIAVVFDSCDNTSVFMNPIVGARRFQNPVGAFRCAKSTSWERKVRSNCGNPATIWPIPGVLKSSSRASHSSSLVSSCYDNVDNDVVWVQIAILGATSGSEAGISNPIFTCSAISLRN